MSTTVENRLKTGQFSTLLSVTLKTEDPVVLELLRRLEIQEQDLNTQIQEIRECLRGKQDTSSS